MNRTAYDRRGGYDPGGNSRGTDMFRGYENRMREPRVRENRAAPGAYHAGGRNGVRTNKRAIGKAKGYSGLLKTVSVLLACALVLCAGYEIIIRISYPRRYEQIVKENCARFGVEETFVYAVIRTESGFDPKARSQVGAMGLMQIMPETFMWLQSKLPSGEDGQRLSEAELYDPEINIRYGVYYLSMLRDEFGSDTLAAAAYHAGGGKVREWLNSGQLAAGCGSDDIPSGATGHYVRKVESARDIYARLYYR